MTKKRIHLLYGWVLTVGLIIAGILLICACVSIYRLGDQPFSPETVAVAFSKISVPVYLCLGLIGGSILLQLCCPVEQKKTVTPQLPMQLAKLQKRLDLNRVSDPEAKAELLALRKKRTLHTAIAYGLLVVCSGIFLSYGLNPANFHQSEINRSMAAAMLLFFPCLAIPFGYGCFAAFYGLRLAKKEIALTRKILNEDCTRQPQMRSETGILWLRGILLCAAVFLLVYGFYAGGTADVLTKAINICTECVGLG